jgi:hypothetical protein
MWYNLCILSRFFFRRSPSSTVRFWNFCILTSVWDSCSRVSCSIADLVRNEPRVYEALLLSTFHVVHTDYRAPCKLAKHSINVLTFLASRAMDPLWRPSKYSSQASKNPKIRNNHYNFEDTQHPGNQTPPLIKISIFEYIWPRYQRRRDFGGLLHCSVPCLGIWWDTHLCSFSKLLS